MRHRLRLTDASFRNFEKILNLRNEKMNVDLMNSRKTAALTAGFRAVGVSDYKICVVIAILCKKQ